MLYFFVALAVVALGYYVAWPLIQSPAPLAEAADGAVPASGAPSRAADELARLHRALAEIDFDHTTGKTNDEDWQLARAPIETRLQQMTASRSERGLRARGLELEIEIHIARARHHLRRSTTSA